MEFQRKVIERIATSIYYNLYEDLYTNYTHGDPCNLDFSMTYSFTENGVVWYMDTDLKVVEQNRIVITYSSFRIDDDADSLFIVDMDDAYSTQSIISSLNEAVNEGKIDIFTLQLFADKRRIELICITRLQDHEPIYEI